MKKLLLLVLVLLSNQNYAQNAELFEHTWYLQKVVVEGDEYPIVDYYTAEPAITEFDEENSTIFISVCQFNCFWATYSFDSEENTIINLSNLEECALTGGCLPPYNELGFYTNLYFSIFYFWDGNEILFNNSFTYSLETDGENYTLTIENTNGDYAVYGDEQLSTGEFEDFKFSVHPNPASDILHIQNLTTTAKAIVYNLIGREIKTKNISGTGREINISQLQNGLYFLVLENPEGKRQTVKFVKK